jgi:hypothetical protein
MLSFIQGLPLSNGGERVLRRRAQRKEGKKEKREIYIYDTPQRDGWRLCSEFRNLFAAFV